MKPPPMRGLVARGRCPHCLKDQAFQIHVTTEVFGDLCIVPGKKPAEGQAHSKYDGRLTRGILGRRHCDDCAEFYDFEARVTPRIFDALCKGPTKVVHLPSHGKNRTKIWGVARGACKG